MKRSAFTFAEVLTGVAVVAILSTILYPVFVQARVSGSASNSPNLRTISMASMAYGQDYDDHIPILINGFLRDLQNVHDGELTSYGEPRADGWPLFVLPYLSSRTTYIDPTRNDQFNIWSGPPLTPEDDGFVANGATYRNQSRFPFFAVNMIFLSPLVVESGEPPSSDFATGETNGFFEASKPARTIFYLPSTRGYVKQSSDDQIGLLDVNRGFWEVNAPGMWGLAPNSSPYVLFNDQTLCSGDWCGGDVDVDTPGVQTRQNTAYIDQSHAGNNVAFLDGHVQFMKPADMAAGTDYLTATPNGFINGGGAMITDKSRYLWNLNQNFYGLY